MILFLDFDGVLHPEGCPRDFVFCRLPLLEDWLRQRLEVAVVITSTWRATQSLDELRKLFSDDVKARVIGGTPLYHRIQPEPAEEWLRYKREAEVREWLRTSSEPAQWVAVDDMPQLFKANCPRLVVCDPKVGLAESTLRRVDDLIRSG